MLAVRRSLESAFEASLRTEVPSPAAPDVEADLAALARQEPDLAPDIVFGARALAAVEARFAGHLLDSWDRGATSLRTTACCPVG